MSRWEPHASQRLVVAALDLFAAQGYENTTVIEIAERAGVTKSTFFRHFSNKRDVLFGDDVVAGPLACGIASAAPDATAIEAIAAGIEVVGDKLFTLDRRTLAAKRRAVISDCLELREREALKAAGLTSTMVRALEQRGVPTVDARVAATLGALAMTLAYERWADDANSDAFGDLARSALAQVQASAAGSRP